MPVEVGGYKLSITYSPRQALFRAVLGEQTFDLSEASPATHIAVVGAGRGDVGLPVRYPEHWVRPKGRSDQWA